VRAAPPTSPFFIAVLLLICAGCATAPTGSAAVQNTAPGISLPSATQVLGQATVYFSAAGEKLEVIHDTSAGIAIVKLPDGALTVLPAELAGSEGRYRDSRMTVWEHDGVILLWIDGKLVFSGRVAK
jgi:hypothetical protein